MTKEENIKTRQEIIRLSNEYIEAYSSKFLTEDIYDDKLGQIVYILQKAMGVADDDDDEIELDENGDVDESVDENIDERFGKWEDWLSECLGTYAKKDVFDLLNRIVKEI